MNIVWVIAAVMLTAAAVIVTFRILAGPQARWTGSSHSTPWWR